MINYQLYKMDILYQLPFPHDVCSKIFIFVCKSPYTGLGVSMFKKKLKNIDLDIPENDKDLIIIDSTKIKNDSKKKYLYTYIY